MMKKLIILLVFMFMTAQAWAAGGTWYTGKPDPEDNVSEGFSDQKDNNRFIEDLGDHMMMYWNGTTPVLGWKDSDASATFLMGPVPLSNITWTSSTDFPLKTGDMMQKYDTKDLYIYNGSSWQHVGGHTPCAASAPFTCNSSTEGWVYSNTTDHKFYRCNGSTWADVSTYDIAGVTSIAGDSGSPATVNGAVSIKGGDGIATATSAGTLTVSYTGTVIKEITETVYGVSCGNSSHCPATKFIANTSSPSLLGLETIQYSGTTGEADYVMFTWNADMHLSATYPITITAYGIIEDAPSALQNKATFSAWLTGVHNDGSLFTSTSASTTITLHDGSSALWTPFTTGDPNSVLKHFSLIIPAGTIASGDVITFFIRRNASYAYDTYEYPVDIAHFAISYRKTQ